MRHFIEKMLIGIALSTALFITGRAEDVASSSQHLLLRNGSIVEGKISQSAGDYVVDLTDGGQIQLKAADVDAVC
jgi:hypothetical protein